MQEKVYIYKVDKDALLREESHLLRLLPEWRKEKAERLKNEMARLQSIAAGRLMDIALNEYSKEYGVERELIKYNISHSGDYVAVALSERPVGIDVEHKDDRSFRITKRMFAREDAIYIGDSQQRFREVWTIKEAFLKCLGIGITVPLDSFTADYVSCDIVTGKSNAFSHNKIISKGFDLKGVDYYFVTTELEDGYSLAICSDNTNIALYIKSLDILRC